MRLIRAIWLPLVLAFAGCYLVSAIWLLGVFLVGDNVLGLADRQAFGVGQAMFVYVCLLLVWGVVLRWAGGCAKRRFEATRDRGGDF